MSAGHDIRVTLPATLEAVEEFCAGYRKMLGLLASPRERFVAELLLREVLCNAVEHGSRGNPSAEIDCAVRLRRERFTIVVRDRGAGFDWLAVRRRPADDSAESGRGLQILSNYAAKVRFCGIGNVVAVTRKFGERGIE